jgi:uncharacterized coiled-coil protein SlyX
LEIQVEQQADDIRYLEQKVENQAHTIERMEEKLENVQTVVRQLLGGLFSHDSQRGMLNAHLDHLCYGKLRGDRKYDDDTSKWCQYPTTRQGDSNETRIEALESQMAAAGELLYNMTNKEIDYSYQQMCSQISDFKYYEGGEDFYKKDSDSDEDEYDDDDTLVTLSSSYDSMPELEPVYSSEGSNSSIEKRRINSYELCGNE